MVDNLFLPGGAVNAVSNLIACLDEIDHYPALYLNNDVLRNAIRRYENVWIPLLSKVPPSQRNSLAPPLDIQWVWMCHMLCPVKYNLDTAAILEKHLSLKDGKILDHRLKSKSQREKAWPRTLALWNKYFPIEPFHLTDEIRSAPLIHLDEQCGHPSHFPDPSSLITYDIVAAAKRQMVFHYQVAVMPHYQSPQFLRESVQRYAKGYLHLQKVFPRDIWVPTMDIDVVWHTHMMHPVLYTSCTERVHGWLLPHDDTFNDRNPGSDSFNRWQATGKTWWSEFNTTIYRPGAMWRGNVSTQERALRPDIVAQSAKLATQFQPHLDHVFEVWEQSKWVLDQQEVVAWRNIEWLHTTQSRGLAQESAADNDTNVCNHMQRFLSIGVNQEQGPLVAARISYLVRKACCLDCDEKFATTIELCSSSANGDGVRYPLATAHDVMTNSMLNKNTVWQFTGCRKLPGEKVLLLRICGQDFAILGGRWVGFKEATKCVRDKWGGNWSRDQWGRDSKRRGRLLLRMWVLNDMENNEWQPLHETRVGEERRNGGPSMTYRCRIRRNPLEPSKKISGQVEIDLKNGRIRVNHSCLGVAGSLLGVCAASLYVGLQPRYKPESEHETMYPEKGMRQGEHEMLRGAGAEVIDGEKRHGLCQMRYEQVAQLGTEGSSGFFVGTVAEFHALTGRVA